MNQNIQTNLDQLQDIELGLDLTVPCKFTNATQRPNTRYKGINGVHVARIVLEQKLGREIRTGFLACHGCNNKLCIEAAHIYEGSSSDNLIDSYKNGRKTYNETKTHCSQGHKYTKENTYVLQGRRYCKECNKIRSRGRKQYHKKREEQSFRSFKQFLGSK